MPKKKNNFQLCDICNETTKTKNWCNTCTSGSVCKKCFLKCCKSSDLLSYDSGFKSKCPFCRSKIPLQKHIIFQITETIFDFMCQKIRNEDTTVVRDIINKYPHFVHLRCNCECKQSLLHKAAHALDTDLMMFLTNKGCKFHKDYYGLSPFDILCDASYDVGMMDIEHNDAATNDLAITDVERNDDISFDILNER